METKMVEAYLTMDSALFGLLQSELEKRNIPYKTKLVHSGTQNRGTGLLLGKIGEKMDREIMYYLYTNAEDVHTVKEIISKRGM